MFTMCQEVYNVVGTSLVAGAGVAVILFVKARYTEYVACKEALERLPFKDKRKVVLQSGEILKFGIVSLVYVGSVCLTMTRLTNVMSTTRSRWYVLCLAVRRVRNPALRTICKQLLAGQAKLYPNKYSFKQTVSGLFKPADV